MPVQVIPTDANISLAIQFIKFAKGHFCKWLRQRYSSDLHFNNIIIMWYSYLGRKLLVWNLILSSPPKKILFLFRFGGRFFALNDCYDKKWRNLAKEVGLEMGIESRLHEVCKMQDISSQNTLLELCCCSCCCCLWQKSKDLGITWVVLLFLLLLSVAKVQRPWNYLSCCCPCCCLQPKAN